MEAGSGMNEDDDTWLYGGQGTLRLKYYYAKSRLVKMTEDNWSRAAELSSQHPLQRLPVNSWQSSFSHGLVISSEARLDTQSTCHKSAHNKPSPPGQVAPMNSARRGQRNHDMQADNRGLQNWAYKLFSI